MRSLTLLVNIKEYVGFFGPEAGREAAKKIVAPWERNIYSKERRKVWLAP